MNVFFMNRTFWKYFAWHMNHSNVCGLIELLLLDFEKNYEILLCIMKNKRKRSLEKSTIIDFLRFYFF